MAKRPNPPDELEKEAEERLGSDPAGSSSGDSQKPPHELRSCRGEPDVQNESLRAALRRLTDELERSNRELEQFAYVASHDLKEPLRMISGFLDLLQSRLGENLDAKSRDHVRYAIEGSNRMRQLIDDLLDFSRVSTRGREAELTDANAAFDRASTYLKGQMQEAQARISRDELPVVRADPSQLVQLFQNLLANAVKFHQKGVAPEVHATASLQGTIWLFSVTDNGIGIDPAQTERVFKVFERLHARDEYGGSGIGLAICKKIVERHGGRIWFEPNPKQGTTFLFTWPV